MSVLLYPSLTNNNIDQYSKSFCALKMMMFCKFYFSDFTTLVSISKSKAKQMLEQEAS